jgi:hypothetical protein
MFDFIGKQLEKIGDLFEMEQYQPRNEKLNAFLHVAGNILFVIACLILVWKGVFFLYESIFPSNSFDTTNQVVRTNVKQLMKSPWVIVALLAAMLFVVRLIVEIKVYIKPFYILTIIGMALLVKKLWGVAFGNDYESYSAFLNDFVKDIFK